MASTREKLEEAGKKILNNSRTELYLSMRFMGIALNSLDYKLDLTTTTVGTDADFIRFNPAYLLKMYIEEPRLLNRCYVHMILHCLFRHMFTAQEKEDPELWDLCCDIAAESVLDTMEYPPIERTVSDFRSGIYQDLQQKVKVLTAERLYHYFQSEEQDFNWLDRLKWEFKNDDHSFWQRMEDQESKDRKPPQTPPDEDRKPPEDQQERKNSGQDPRHLRRVRPREDEWQKNADRIRAELDVMGKEASDEKGSLERILDFTAGSRTDYREFLQKFAIVREETAIDLDSFDYGFYNYGMEVYGNMPLIEENEYREARKVEDLVIAIDTSASCQEVLVQKFLRETATLLHSQENFFHKVNIHIIECDDQVQNDVLITGMDDMEKYTEGFSVKGGYGTDFRPVFRYVEQLQKSGELAGLKGLMYFTDGYGVYPTRPTPYDTAFVFWTDEDHSDKDVPSWALKLYLQEEDLI